MEEQFGLAKENKHNLVASFVHHKIFSLQGVNLAGNMFKDTFATFHSLEHSLLDSIDPKKGCHSSLPTHLSWVWTSLVPSGNTSSSETISNEILTSVENYIIRLKDYCGYS